MGPDGHADVTLAEPLGLEGPPETGPQILGGDEEPTGDGASDDLGAEVVGVGQRDRDGVHGGSPVSAVRARRRRDADGSG